MDGLLVLVHAMLYEMTKVEQIPMTLQRQRVMDVLITQALMAQEHALVTTVGGLMMIDRLILEHVMAYVTPVQVLLAPIVPHVLVRLALPMWMASLYANAITHTAASFVNRLVRGAIHDVMRLDESSLLAVSTA